MVEVQKEGGNGRMTEEKMDLKERVSKKLRIGSPDRTPGL